MSIAILSKRGTTYQEETLTITVHKLVITHVRFWSQLPLLGCKPRESSTWLLHAALLSPQPELITGTQQIFLTHVEGQDVSIFLEGLTVSRTITNNKSQRRWKYMGKERHSVWLVALGVQPEQNYHQYLKTGVQATALITGPTGQRA